MFFYVFHGHVYFLLGKVFVELLFAHFYVGLCLLVIWEISHILKTTGTLSNIENQFLKNL